MIGPLERIDSLGYFQVNRPLISCLDVAWNWTTERHYFRNKLIRSYDFNFHFCIPNSTNTWEAIYEMPELTEEERTQYQFCFICNCCQIGSGSPHWLCSHVAYSRARDDRSPVRVQIGQFLFRRGQAGDAQQGVVLLRPVAAHRRWVKRVTAAIWADFSDLRTNSFTSLEQSHMRGYCFPDVAAFLFFPSFLICVIVSFLCRFECSKLFGDTWQTNQEWSQSWKWVMAIIFPFKK